MRQSAAGDIRDCGSRARRQPILHLGANREGCSSGPGSNRADQGSKCASRNCHGFAPNFQGLRYSGHRCSVGRLVRRRSPVQLGLYRSDRRAWTGDCRGRPDSDPGLLRGATPRCDRLRRLRCRVAGDLPGAGSSIWPSGRQHRRRNPVSHRTRVVDRVATDDDILAFGQPGPRRMCTHLPENARCRNRHGLDVMGAVQNRPHCDVQAVACELAEELENFFDTYLTPYFPKLL